MDHNTYQKMVLLYYEPPEALATTRHHYCQYNQSGSHHIGLARITRHSNQIIQLTHNSVLTVMMKGVTHKKSVKDITV